MKSLLSTLLFVAACGEAHPASVDQHPATPVGVVTVARRDVPLYTEAISTLDAYVNVEMRARVRGYLQSQSYKDGARVRAGDVLFRIEPGEYGTAGAAADANLARAKVALDKAKLEVERDRGLQRAGMISRQDVDNAEAAVHDAEAVVRANSAELARTSLDLRYTTVRSPIDGVAGLAQVRVGNLVGQDGPTLLTTVSQLDPMRIDFPLPEVDYVKHPEWFAHLDERDLAWASHELARLDGDPSAAGVELVLADGSTYAHRGAIVAVDRKIDATTGTVRLQALVANPDRLLRPGEFAHVRIRHESDGKNVVVVPEEALIAVQGTLSVAVVGADHKVAIKRLELGPSVAGMRVVISGLSGGEQIVIDGLQRVADGAIVDPHPVTPPAKS